jgi:hypothetical protein
MSRLRRTVIVSALAAAGVSAVAVAQVGVRVNWTAPGGVPKTCVITSDAAGVSMDANGQLSMNGSFGTDCPTGVTTPPLPPVITNGLDAAELPASSAIGATHVVTWSADADACSYAGSNFPVPVPGWPTSGDMCTSAASCATTQSAAVLLPGAGSYTFALSCRRNGVTAPVTSQRTVVVPPVTGACVAPVGLSRLNDAYVEFNYTVDNGRTTPATQFASIFGYFDEATPLKPFPGTVNLNQRIFLAHNHYVALEFTVPATLSTQTYGRFRFEETTPQASTMSWTISKACGDFGTTPTAPMTQACIINGGAPGAGLPWSIGTTVPGFCRLERGQTYYLNLVHASLTTPLLSTCPRSGHCGSTMQHQFEAGSVPWP